MRRALITIAGGMLVAVTAQAQDAPAGSAERGRGIYMQQLCYNCHGTVGHGGGVAGPKIAPQPFPWGAFARQIRVPRLVMPPYSAKNLPDQDLADIYAYLVSIKPGQPAQDIPLLSGM
jgi:ubiquinol-cytochrome c reductase cytochrome c subunit